MDNFKVVEHDTDSCLKNIFICYRSIKRNTKDVRVKIVGGLSDHVADMIQTRGTRPSPASFHEGEADRFEGRGVGGRDQNQRLVEGRVLCRRVSQGQHVDLIVSDGSGDHPRRRQPEVTLPPPDVRRQSGA